MVEVEAVVPVMVAEAATTPIGVTKTTKGPGR